jgi:hypothetical protein
MSTSSTHAQRFATMSFARVYPLYLAKVELHQVLEWLTGFNDKKLKKLGNRCQSHIAKCAI